MSDHFVVDASVAIAWVHPLPHSAPMPSGNDESLLQALVQHPRRRPYRDRFHFRSTARICHTTPMNIEIRPAVAGDAPFLAWVQQEAARSHVPKGFWDLAFPGPEADRLRILERMLTAESRSLCHGSGFLVACVDGRPAAALSGYTQASVAGGSAFHDAMAAALDAEGWDTAAREALADRIAPFFHCIPETDDDVWVVEWVATRPEFRGRGLVRSMLPQILDRGREHGLSRFQICVLIGNVPAQRAYEGAGFRFYDEKRHPDFERAMACPGILRMTQ